MTRRDALAIDEAALPARTLGKQIRLRNRFDACERGLDGNTSIEAPAQAPLGSL
jgi:hypothetical protein